MQISLGNDYYLVVGKATRDAELKHVGAKESAVCSFSLSLGKRQDTTTIFANCKAWHGLATYSENIQKGDTVAVIGKTESREYNGKTYTDLVAEWLNIIPNMSSGNLSPSGKPYPQGTKFEETGDDGDLPF